jgi:hypothetical protein
MGPGAGNDVGIYDDASVIISPDKFATFNFNTDASRLGWNSGVGKPYGLLQPGKWYFYRGLHKGQYKALRQATEDEARRLGIPTNGNMRVLRCWGPGDKRNYFESGYFAINDHSGNDGSTSSWLCQTTPPDQYWHRYHLIDAEMDKHGQKYIAGRLIEA